MTKIRIKNFGPIRSGCIEKDGWLDVKKVTLFIGNQGTGKSTVAKLISTFTWIEKALTRGDYDAAYFEKKDRFKSFLEYHKISEYLPEYARWDDFQKNKEIPVLEYLGSSYKITYSPRHLEIQELNNLAYSLPQIMYVPSERNFISTIEDPKFLRITSEPLVELLTELRRAKEKIITPINLPINSTELSYNENQNMIYITGDSYKVSLDKASSGFQSIVPLYLVSWFLANQVKDNDNSEVMNSDESSRFQTAVKEIYRNPDLNEEQRRLALSAVSYRFKKTSFVNIVEEPEQNLFPQSQWAILTSLLEMNNWSLDNKLIMTSHSPYIINFLTLCVKAGILKHKMSEALCEKLNLNQIVPLQATILREDLIIYEIDEKGSITELPDYNGLPNDDNYLNQNLEYSNQQFSKLLDLEMHADRLL
jgi:predicted ATPase